MIIDPQFAQIVFLKCLVNKPSVSRLWAGAAVEGALFLVWCQTWLRAALFLQSERRVDGEKGAGGF